ncbi:MAG: beta-1,6-N-acetylglucosaminyltransferase [Fulvivirga sp.]|nr:beta-1,6-N-acetylglucosaminyltransferase [Fulvivirga sp.]
MKIAFLIMAYKNPDQIARLVRTMKHPSFDFYIHVDAKFDLAPFEYIAEEEQVYFTRTRRKIYWAAFRFTQTIVECAEDILNNKQYDFISLISGQDYPIKPIEEIAEHYNQHLGASFFSLVDEDDTWWDHAITRINKYHMTNYDFKGRYLLQRFLNATLPNRKLPVFKTLYGGPRATWWTVSSDCMRYIIQFMKENKKLIRFSKFTWAPDEFLIPTIVMNSDFRDSVIKDSGVYIDWSQGGSNPKVLTIEDYPQLKKSDKLTARKFDTRVDTEILDRIDKELLKTEN